MPARTRIVTADLGVTDDRIPTRTRITR